MKLRTRLLLVLVGMVAVGLVVTDIVTYTQLRSFLLARIDPQLHGSSFAVSRVLEAQAGIGPTLRFTAGGGVGVGSGSGSGSVTTPSTATGSGTGGTRGGGTAAGTTGSTGSSTTGSTSSRFHGRHPGSFLVAGAGSIGSFGEFGELVTSSGKLFGKPLPSLYGGRTPPSPVLPTPLPHIGSSGYAIFDASSRGAGAVTYRVLIRPVGADKLTEVVATPLTDVDDTLGRLLGIELAVSLVVLLGLCGLAWVVVRRGLRPLDHMGEAAGEIAGGDLARRVSPADDRTEVGRLGVALNGMLETIETAFAAQAASEERLRHFLADASHELRTPLTSIRGYAELFDLGARSRPADLATAMHHIRDEAARMGVLVDDLLLLARLDQERPLHRQQIDLAEVVRRSVDARRVAAPGQRIEVDAPSVLAVDCDGLRMRQVVDNLLVNAVRHSPADRPVEVRLAVESEQVVLEVSDHGSGVPPELTTRIFEPFFRPDVSRARQTGGAGLGLAIVAAIARAHGGSVGVGAVNGGGAKFWVKVPATLTSADHVRAPEPSEHVARPV